MIIFLFTVYRSFLRRGDAERPYCPCAEIARGISGPHAPDIMAVGQGLRRALDELYEFGVAVRFANHPDLDPMDPDDRVIVTLSFKAARCESMLLGLRVQCGLRAKRESGGFCGIAPDGYRNMETKVVGDLKRQYGRHSNWIEIDPERAPVWRYAWDLLLEGKLTLEEICEMLHGRGYLSSKGRPFVEVKPNGKRRAIKSTLSAAFHNWTYAGWVTSKTGQIPPKTIRGNWEAIVTTEEFERGLTILNQRDDSRGRHRKHDYLLKGWSTTSYQIRSVLLN